MTSAQTAEKLLVALITASIVALTTFEQFKAIFVVLGYGHFVVSSYFHYRAGKVSRRYLARYCLAAIAIFGAYAVYPNHNTLGTVTAIGFAIHAISDELFLLQSPPAVHRTLTAISIFAIFGFSRGFYPYDIYALIVAGALLFFGQVVRLLSRHPLTGVDVYIFTIVAALLAATWLQIDSWDLFGIAVIYHYFSWYISAFCRYRTNASKLAHYLVAVVVCNAAILGLLFLYLNVGQAHSVLAYLFRRNYFYLWTCLHIVATFRRQDLAHLSRVAVPVAIPAISGL